MCDVNETRLVCSYDHLTKVMYNYNIIVHYYMYYDRAIALLNGMDLMVVQWQLLMILKITVELM